jgi:hypothetical protein
MTIVQPTASAGATFHALNLANETGPELSSITRHTTFEWDNSMGFCQEKISSNQPRAALL